MYLYGDMRLSTWIQIKDGYKTKHVDYLYVSYTLSTLTIMEPNSVECQDLLIPCQIKNMCGQNSPDSSVQRPIGTTEQ